MIQRYFYSGIYTKDELRKDLLHFFYGNERNVELFIEGLIQTQQIISRGNAFELRRTHRESKLSRPTSFDFPVEYGVAGKFPRVAIRGSESWVDRYGFPTDMRLIRVFADGEIINISEKPLLNVRKPRRGRKEEQWIAEIPAFYRKKYDISDKVVARVRVYEVTPDFLTLIQLWGYRYRVMIIYEYKDKEGLSSRLLELDGFNFVDETGRDILGNIEKTGGEIVKIITDLLEQGDEEYYVLCEIYCQKQIAKGEAGEHTPLKESTSLNPVVQFRDLLNPKVILEWTTKEPYNSIPPVKAFYEVINLISTGLKDARQSSKLLKKGFK